jgi:hypothetical protein
VLGLFGGPLCCGGLFGVLLCVDSCKCIVAIYLFHYLRIVVYFGFGWVNGKICGFSGYRVLCALEF